MENVRAVPTFPFCAALTGLGVVLVGVSAGVTLLGTVLGGLASPALLAGIALIGLSNAFTDAEDSSSGLSGLFKELVSDVDLFRVAVENGQWELLGEFVGLLFRKGFQGELNKISATVAASTGFFLKDENGKISGGDSGERVEGN